MNAINLLVIGGSAGSLEVILRTLPQLHLTGLPAIVIVLHRKSDDSSPLVELLSLKTGVPVKEAEEKETILPDTIYVAPADYHLLIEKNHTFSLDYSEKINYSRPCIDITFQTAAEAYGTSLACILLSGANADGSDGLEAVQEAGGTIAVQNPVSCEVPYMPQQALQRVRAHHILGTGEFGSFINSLNIGSRL